jgi:hypothetical protein
MSAFDSAMLMIEDLTTQVVELEQQVWDLQTMAHAKTQELQYARFGKMGNVRSAKHEAHMHVKEMLNNEA